MFQIPWYQRFSYIFLRMRELRESREVSALRGKRVKIKKNLWDQAMFQRVQMRVSGERQAAEKVKIWQS